MNLDLGHDKKLWNLNGKVYRERNKINQELDFWVAEITTKVSAYFVQTYARAMEGVELNIFIIYKYLHYVQSKIVYDNTCHISVGFTGWNEGTDKCPCIRQKKKCIFDLTCLGNEN